MCRLTACDPLAGFPACGQTIPGTGTGTAQRCQAAWRWYRVRFANGDDLAHVPVPVDDARRLSSRFRRDRDAAYRIEGVPGRAVEERGRKTLYVTVARVEMSLPNGPTVAVVDLADEDCWRITVRTLTGFGPGLGLPS